MAFAWLDFLPLAERVADDGDEASARSAICRASYAAYHAAAAFARVRGMPDRGHTRRRVWDASANPPALARSAAGAVGDRPEAGEDGRRLPQPLPRRSPRARHDSVDYARFLVATIKRLR